MANEFEIALSFTGEHRELVEKIAELLAAKLGGRQKVLYDRWLNGVVGRPNLHRYLLPKYKKSRLLVCFLCKGYEQKEWCGLEWSVVFDLIKRHQDQRVVLLSIGKGRWQDLTSLDHVWNIEGLDPAEVAAKILGRYEDAKSPDASPALDALIAELRNQVRADIDHRCGKIKILSMPDPKRVGELYTDVNLLAKRPSKDYSPLAELKKGRSANPSEFVGKLGERKERIPGSDIFHKSHRMIIYGAPGAGKTTFLKRLATQCNQGYFKPDLVPVFIPLKAFAESAGSPPLVERIRHDWIGSRQTEQVLKAGRALVLLDGFDEVREADFQRIHNQIQSFTESYPRCTLAVTCRTAARENRIGLEHLSEAEMADFDTTQIRQFAHNWFKMHEQDAKTELFMEKLEANERLSELATKPLLLTLLCLVFQEGFSFDTRAKLYEKALTVLLEVWDGKRSIERDRPHNLTIDAMTALLEQIAYSRFLRSEYFFEGRDLSRQIERYFTHRPNLLEPGQTLNVPGILQSAESHLGLLVQRATDLYSFSHLTFQEYLTARHIARTQKVPREMKEAVGEAHWREVWLTVLALSEPTAGLLKLKDCVDGLLTVDGRLQDVLKWVLRKSAQRDGFKPAAVRGFYLGIALALALARARALARALALALGLPDLATDLETLRSRLPQWSAESRAQFDWKEWTSELQRVTIRHRDIGHDWNLTDHQKTLLDRYYNANLFLVECMNSQPNLPTTTRQFIEDTLLLPYDELQKIPVPPPPDDLD